MMNSLGVGGLDSVQAAAITADLNALLSDTNLGATLTVSTPTGSALDPRTGTVGSSGSAPESVTGWWSPLSARETGPESAYEVGDRRFSVPVAGLTVIPTTASILRDGSTRYAVIAVETAQIGGATVFYHLIARKSG